MTITPADIKILASARMTDALDAGGPMTGSAIIDGQKNNVFTDPATVNRAVGELQLRRLFPAVLTPDTDTLLEAHALIDGVPADAAVSGVLLRSPVGQTLADLAAALNAAGGEAYDVCGAVTTTASVGATDTTVAVDQVRVPLLPKARLSSPASGSLVGTQALPTVRAYVPGNGGGDLIPVLLPLLSTQFSTISGQTVYEVLVPAGTAYGSERVVFPGSGGSVSAGMATPPLGEDFQALGALSFGTVSRATGAVNLVFATSLPGSSFTVQYAEGGSTTVLSSAALSAAAFNGSGQVTLTTNAGKSLAGAQFGTGTPTPYFVIGGVVRVGSVTGTIVGTYSKTSGVISVPSAAGLTITDWKAAEISDAYAVSSADASIPSNLDPSTLEIQGQEAGGAAFTATTDAFGVVSGGPVSGTYVAATGALTLTFSTPVRLATLVYAATLLAPQTSIAPVWGIDESKLATDGTVPVVRAGQVAVLRHREALAPDTYTAGGPAISLGRTNLSDVRIVGANGLGIGTGWSADLAAGELTISSVSGWSQPVVVQHVISHTALVLGVPTQGSVVLNRSPGRVFPAGSHLCTALLLGDFQANVGAPWSQQTWTNEWADARIGNAIAAQYNSAVFPMVVRNDGAITERWLFLFKTATTFDFIGESVGQVASGDINSLFAPPNPATGQPYISVPAGGFGAGWFGGNVLRVNTRGANAPMWAARCTLPSGPGGADQILVAVRGDIAT